MKKNTSPLPWSDQFDPSVQDAPQLSTDPLRIRAVIWGQRWVIASMLVYAVGAGVGLLLQGLSLPILLAGVILLASVGVGTVGLLRVGHGLGYHPVVRLLMAISLWVPLLGLVVLGVVNADASQRLRQAGYTVGLLGITGTP